MADSTTPLLAGEGGGSEDAALKLVVSDCKLQDKCFLSDGAATSSQSYKKVQRKLVTACILCFIFMTLEVIGGYIARSVAIMSDAAHMLSDVSAFLVSIFAAWAATQPSTWHYSFGYHRAEILGALVSVLTIWAVTGALLVEAVQRTINPVRVDGRLMFFISLAGVAFNVLIALTLGVHGHLGHSNCSHGHDGHDHDHDHDPSHGDCGQSHGGSKHGGSKHGHSHSNGSTAAGSKCSGHKHGDDDGHAHEGERGHSHDSDCDHGDHEHDHSHDGHNHGSSSSSAASPAAAVVIDVPAAPAPSGSGGSCGQQQGLAVSRRCTISRTGSREIEVRCELPPEAAAAARARSSSHGGHGHGHDGGSINLRSAVLHVIGDLVQSIGVAIAGALIWANQDDPRWYLADPICTFVFSVVVLLTTRAVLRDIIHVLMERTPLNLDIPQVAQVMMAMEGIRDVHDLHVWTISTSTAPVLTAHVHIGPDADANEVLQRLEGYVRGLGIDHSTIQICNISPAADA